MICTVMLLAFGKSYALALADELIKAKDNQSNQESPHLHQIQTSAGGGYRTPLDPDCCGLISAGELWQFFHQQGFTTVDRLTLWIDQAESLSIEELGTIRFQIEDPTTGSYLTNIQVNGSNRLEIPLDYDYMKRFSANSQELIRLELPKDGMFSNTTEVSIDADRPLLTTLNLILFSGFVVFWLSLFYALNRLTRPLEEATEDIVIRKTESTDDQTFSEFESNESRLHALGQVPSLAADQVNQTSSNEKEVTTTKEPFASPGLSRTAASPPSTPNTLSSQVYSGR